MTFIVDGQMTYFRLFSWLIILQSRAQEGRVNWTFELFGKQIP